MRDVYTAGPICVALELPMKAKQGRRVSPRESLTANHPKDWASYTAKLEGNWRSKRLDHMPHNLSPQEAELDQAPALPFRDATKDSFPENRSLIQCI